MRLIDFKLDVSFKGIKEKMSIPEEYPLEYDFEYKGGKVEFELHELMELETGKGKEINLEEIEVGAESILNVNGKSAILYIKNQNTGGGYKYHVSWCSKLEEMKNDNRGDRYVVSRRNDGTFYANIIDRDKNVIEEDKKVKMNVCRYCLRNLDYKNYKSNPSIKDKVYDEFSIEEFLKEYDTKFDYLPRHTEDTIAVDVYSEEWNEISKRYREYRMWTCEKCGEKLSHKKNMLDTHHIDGNKSNNIYRNFKALCKRCHSEEPNHEHYKEELRKRGII